MRTGSSAAFGNVRVDGTYLWTFITSILFKFSLVWGYIDFIAPNYLYAGFQYQPSFVRFVEGWTVYLGLFMLIPKRFEKPSDLFMLIFYFSLVAPLTVYYEFGSRSQLHFYMALSSFVIVALLRNGVRIKLPVIASGRKIGLYLSIGVVLFVVAWLFVSGGVRLLNFDLRRVYDFRDAAVRTIQVGAMAYIVEWAFKVFNPALLMYLLWKRHKLLAAAVIMLQVFFFAVSTQKAVLFYPVIIIGVWFWFSKRNTVWIVPAVLGLVIAGSLISYLYFGATLPSSLMVRRLYFVIVKNLLDYLQFFSNPAHPHVFWSDSILANWITYPYDVPPPILIGLWQGVESHVNNSYIALGFMHAGYTGILFYSVLVAIIFRVADSLATHGIEAWMAAALLAVPVRSLILSSDLPTALLTHGILPGMFLLFLFRKAERNDLEGSGPGVSTKTNHDNVANKVDDRV